MAIATTKKGQWRARLKKRWLAFRAWQERPYEVAPLSHETHDCPTCQTHYEGNYCPRCGQSAKIGRFSAKKALLLFLDVWGLGNRGMFRSLRDLLLRPGYMIRDYLGGMQMAYFPPFKMFFILTAFNVLISHGLNIKLENYSDEEIKMEVVDNLTGAENEFEIAIYNMGERLMELTIVYPNITEIISILVFSILLFPVFRKRRVGDHLSFSEFFIAMIYSGNMISILNNFLGFFCIPGNLLAYNIFLFVIPLKQLSGFSWKKTIGWFLAMTFLLILLFILISVIFLLAS